MSYLSHVARQAGFPVLRAALAEDDPEQGYWCNPDHLNAFRLTRPIVSDVKQAMHQDVESGRLEMREVCTMTVSLEEMVANGVTEPLYGLKFQLPTGAWVLDLAETVWSDPMVRIALARRPLIHMQEMRSADV